MIFKPQSFHGEPPAVVEEHPPEAELEQRVAEAIALTDATGALDLKVVASGSEIFLLSAASSEQEMERAVETALSVNGVTKVTVRLGNL